MDCPGRLPHITIGVSDWPGFNPCFNGLSRRTGAEQKGPRGRHGFNPCFNGLSRRTPYQGPARQDRVASTLVLMDCPGGRADVGPPLTVMLLQPLF